MLMGEWVKRHLLNLALGACVAAALPAPPVEAAASAVIIMYHRFGEDSLPSTNIGIDQFEAQIGELVTGGYSVLPFPGILPPLPPGAL